MNFDWSSEVGAADWWTTRLSPDLTTVGGYVPDCLASFCVIRSSWELDGSLEREELAALASVAAAQSSSDRLWAAVWEGFGQFNEGAYAGLVLGHDGEVTWKKLPALAPPNVHAGPKVQTPGRALLLLEGPLAGVVDLYDRLGGQSPTAWWPADRAWVIVTEIDFRWTYVAGSDELISAVLTNSALDASSVARSDPTSPPNHGP